MRARACVAEGEGEDDTGGDSESETWEDKGNGLEEERGGVQEEARRGGQEGERGTDGGEEEELAQEVAVGRDVDADDPEGSRVVSTVILSAAVGHCWRPGRRTGGRAGLGRESGSCCGDWCFVSLMTSPVWVSSSASVSTANDEGTTGSSRGAE